MTYLLINHVPFGRGSTPDRFVVGDMWLEDLRGQACAIAAAGMKLVVATPLVDKLDLAASGSFNAVEIIPSEHGFSYTPLPFYISFKQYLQTRRKMSAAMTDAIRGADIVQAGYGGHPVALGEIAWPIAAALGRKRIWVFDGGDPFPQWRFHAATIKNPLKRRLRLMQLRHLEAFIRRAVAQADVVFAHNNSVVERFADVWNERCHQFHRSFVTRDLLISDQALADRQRRLLDRSHPLRLIATGRQIAIKGTDQLLHAVRQAIDHGANLELDVLGDGEDLARYEALAAELGLGQHVRFAGSVPYGPPLFDAWGRSHATVVTNLTSEFSRNLLLSMAHGLPLITYSNPGDAVVESSGAAIVVPLGNVPALAEALTEAERNREQLADLAARALKLVTRNDAGEYASTPRRVRRGLRRSEMNKVP